MSEITRWTKRQWTARARMLPVLGWCWAFALTSRCRGADQWLVRAACAVGPWSVDLTFGRYDWHDHHGGERT